MIQKDSYEIFRLTAADTVQIKDEHGTTHKKNYDGIVVRVDAEEMPTLIRRSLKLRLNSMHGPKKDPIGFDKWKKELVAKGETNFRDIATVKSDVNETLKQQNAELLEAAKKTVIQMANLLASTGSDLENAIETIGKTCPLPGDTIVSLCTSTFEEFFKANPKKANPKK